MEAAERSKVTRASWGRMQAGEGFLYAAQLPDGVIKIGFALQPARRARELKATIVATVRGTRAQELALHAKLLPFLIPNYGGRPGASEFYVPAALTHGPVPEGFRKGTQAHPAPRARTAGRPKGYSDAKVIELHAGGRKTLQEVGDALGLTRERVRQILKRNEIATRRGQEGRTLPTAIYRERFDRYKQAIKPGMRTREALAAAGLTYTEVRHAADVLGEALPKLVRRERIRYRAIADYYIANPHVTGSDAARHFNVSEMTISHALAQMGVHSRQSGWSHKRPKQEEAAA